MNLKPLNLFNRYWAAGVVGLTGLILSSIATFIVHRWEVAEDRERFQQQSTVLVSELQRQVDSYIQLTRSVGTLFNTSESVTLHEFQEFSRSLLPYYNGLLGLGWAKKVDAQERLSYEQQFHSQGAVDFTIRDRDSAGNKVAAGKRPVHFPTTYLEPSEQLQDSIGWDAASDPKRLSALKKVERLGVSAATPLVQLENGKSGFVLYYPVFRVGDQSLSSEKSDANATFQGAVFGLYEVKTWIETATVSLNLNGLDFYLYHLPEDHLNSALNKSSITANDSFLIAYKADTKTLTDSPQRANLIAIDSNTEQSPRHCSYSSEWEFCIRSIHMAKQELSLLVLPSDNRTISSWRSGAVFALGLLATGSLVMYLSISKRATLRVESKNQELEQLLQQLQQTQLQLIQTEKMSSLGRLVAGVAHEINNPVSFIAGNVEYANTYSQNLFNLLRLYQAQYPHPGSEIETAIEESDLEFIAEDLPNLFDSMKVGAERLRKIVLSLRNFSRLDESEVKEMDVHAGIDSTLMILGHRFKAQSNRNTIQVVKDYGSLPLIECHSGQLNQVFMNILANAIDALEELVSVEGLEDRSPTIQIKTTQVAPDWIAIQISDNGSGIAPEIQTRLFDPFFTTKPIGKGTGLGLAISYQIINEKHGGYLLCSSEVGVGTEFTIKLPIAMRVQGNCKMAIAVESVK